MVSLVKRSYLKTGWSVQPIFKYDLHVKDLPLLEEVKAFFGGAGHISVSATRSSAYYSVNSTKEIIKFIIPHFDSYPLLTKKRGDFELFKSAVELINKGEHLDLEGLSKIVAIRASMNWGLTPTLKEHFPNIVKVIRPEFNTLQIISPYWFVGFVEGEGSFFVDIFSSKTHKVGYQVKLKFQLTQHIRDTQLMNSLIESLDCGTTRVNRQAVDLTVTKLSEIESKILPIFYSCPLLGVKRLDYEDFCKVVLAIKGKEHLTEPGLIKIKQIKSGMNTGRDLGRG